MIKFDKIWYEMPYKAYCAEFRVRKVLTFHEMNSAVAGDYLEDLTVAMLENVIEETKGFIKQIEDGGIDLEDRFKNV